MSADLLSIGAVADATGVAVSAVRYYDARGLVAAAGRVGGKRRFDPAAVGRVNFIRRSQQLGLSLDEIETILCDTDGGWTAVVDQRLAALRDQADEVATMITLLEEVRACGCSAIAECPRSEMIQ